MADPSTSPPLTRASVLEARQLIQKFVHHTPTLTNATLDRLASTPLGQRDGDNGIVVEDGRKPANPKIRLYFKCENWQRVGAFKIRGAFHALERLKMEPGWEAGGGRERGVVTHSSGELSLFFVSCYSFILGGKCPWVIGIVTMGIEVTHKTIRHG